MHLQCFPLPDSLDNSETREIDLFTGLDHYYDVISGQIVRGSSGPIALRSKLGWMLSGAVDRPELTTNLSTNVNSSLILDCSQPVSERKENNREISDALGEFWKYENFGLIASGSTRREIKLDQVSKSSDSDSSAAESEWHITPNLEKRHGVSSYL